MDKTERLPPYVPVIVNYSESGRSEFVIRDVPTVTRQGPEYDTLLDMETREVVGFAWPTSTPPPTPAVAKAVEALTECEEVLRMHEQPAFVDPVHGEEVDALGRRIGYGALMSSASASWRAKLVEDGVPVGMEFVAGPCHETLVKTLAMVRAALSALRGEG